jgi:ABC-type branched-subunit amino acid transport system ATPase component
VGLLSAHDLVAGYAPGEEILKGVGLRLEPGEVISIIGPNGAGKSTLLKAIAGILRPSRGEIRFRDRRIETLRPREICALGLAFVPQEMNIFPTMSVTENLEIGEHLHRLREEGLSFLIIEHHMDAIARLCEPVVVMAEGRKLAEGSFAEIALREDVQEAYMGRRKWAS